MVIPLTFRSNLFDQDMFPFLVCRNFYENFQPSPTYSHTFSNMEHSQLFPLKRGTGVLEVMSRQYHFMSKIGNL